MRDEKSLMTAKKWQSPQVQMRAVFMASISKFQSVITAERPNTVWPEIYLISEWAGVDKIRLVILLRIHRGAEMDPQNGKSSHEQETASFCSRFNTDPPRPEADRRSKSKQSPGSSSEIDAILDWAAKWWMSLPVTQVVIDMLCSDQLYCPSTNQVLALLEQLIPWTRDRVKELQSFFRRPCPPPPLPTGILYSPRSPVSFALRDPHLHLRSHGKIGDCEQSTSNS